MAPRLQYEAKQREPIGQSAHEELEQLLQTLHEHGVLRLANDIVAANTEIARVVVEGMSKEGSMRAMQNLSILLMALSRVEPSQFYKLVFALKDALVAFESPPGGSGGHAPGLLGAFWMLYDQQLWRALNMVIDSLELFTKRLDQKVDKPISAFTGKATSA